MNVWALLPTFVSLVAITGGLVGYFAKSRGDSIIAYQAKALELRNDDISRLEKQNTALATERDSLLAQNKTLASLAQGSPELIKLTEEIKRLATEISRAMKVRS